MENSKEKDEYAFLPDDEEVTEEELEEIKQLLEDVKKGNYKTLKEIEKDFDVSNQGE
jgi:hypothetical protein